MNDIIVYDNVLSSSDTSRYNHMIFNTCPFFYGEVDNPNTPPTGLVCDFTNMEGSVHPEVKILLSDLLYKIYEKQPCLKNKKLYRLYINLFTPREVPYFHIDGEKTTTCLYYINPHVSYDEGGETQFIVDDEIKTVSSKPGRLVIFNGELKHRATSFRNYPRLTLAYKFVTPQQCLDESLATPAY